MKVSISKTQKVGRPRTNATPVLVRLRPEDLARLDEYASGWSESMSRPEAIRAILRDYFGSPSAAVIQLKSKGAVTGAGTIKTHSEKAKCGRKP